MFKYAVRVVRDREKVVASLVDWSEVTTIGFGDPIRALKVELLASIEKCSRCRLIIPLPSAKPSPSFFVRLSAGESMKVMVLNAMFAKGLDFYLVARNLDVSEDRVRQAVDLALPADVDLLNRILGVVGKRLLASTVES